MSEILFLAHRVPFPPDRGDKIRSWNILKAVTKIAPTHVCALWDQADDREAGRAEIATIAASCAIEPVGLSKTAAMVSALVTGQSASVRAFSSPALARRVSSILRNRPISGIYAFSGQMAQFVPAYTQARFVMDFVDMDSAKFEQFARDGSGLSAFANAQEAKRLFAFERSIAHRAHVSTFVSEAEAALFRQRTGLGADRVVALENGIDLDSYNPALPRSPEPARQKPLIVFTGQMDYAPNVEAVRIFATEVMPLIRARNSSATFAIVGRAPTAEVQSLAMLPGVIVTGGVPDTRDWLAAGDVVVAPLRLARGIQNKVLEAMAMARPVVASPAAAEGIDAVNGRDFVVADGVAAEAEAVLALLANPDQADALGKAARARMIDRYGWDARMADLPRLLGFDPALSARAA